MVCEEKKEKINISIEENTLSSKNGSFFSTLQFHCPYGFQGGTVTCCYPYNVSSYKVSRQPAWFLPILTEAGSYPEEAFTSECPVYKKIKLDHGDAYIP